MIPLAKLVKAIRQNTVLVRLSFNVGNTMRAPL